MSGRYNGLQAKIKELNPLAVYIPCAAHSLNLVGTHAVRCSNEAANFFHVQHLYTFFSGSTHRWKVLTVNLKSESKTLKRLSGTRLLENDNNEPPETRNEASGLRKKFEKLETAFMAIFWGFILNRLNVVSKKLQSVEIDITVVLELEIILMNLRKRQFYELKSKNIKQQLQEKTKELLHMMNQDKMMFS
ncbi:hypothetical protein AGLY_003385 [Aphis glycines]|uniref:DUF4371 domain-containing protein n=1 Tax=Aphis glycines TaxID=307491 RepID=A0A6G0U0D5_APHGL|nr:hypothetical protein AGLY_003385 [Aphis glycines]